MELPKLHPRYESLDQRHRLIAGVEAGYVAQAGLIAHGRGEAFDYLLGEKTTKHAEEAEKAAVATLFLAENPAISVNGNVAALVPAEIVKLSKSLNAKLEINLFYRTPEREKKIAKILKGAGAEKVFGLEKTGHVPGLDSERGRIDADGMLKADVVLVPLEDGDRTEALAAMGKTVIAIDLNPLSRTSQGAAITIVDNVVRAIPNMIGFAQEMKGWDRERLKSLVDLFDNKDNLNTITKKIREGI